MSPLVRKIVRDTSVLFVMVFLLFSLFFVVLDWSSQISFLVRHHISSSWIVFWLWWKHLGRLVLLSILSVFSTLILFFKRFRLSLFLTQSMGVSRRFWITRLSAVFFFWGILILGIHDVVLSKMEWSPPRLRQDQIFLKNLDPHANTYAFQSVWWKQPKQGLLSLHILPRSTLGSLSFYGLKWEDDQLTAFWSPLAVLSDHTLIVPRVWSFGVGDPSYQEHGPMSFVLDSSFLHFSSFPQSPTIWDMWFSIRRLQAQGWDAWPLLRSWFVRLFLPFWMMLIVWVYTVFYLSFKRVRA